MDQLRSYPRKSPTNTGAIMTPFHTYNWLNPPSTVYSFRKSRKRELIKQTSLKIQFRALISEKNSQAIQFLKIFDKSFVNYIFRMLLFGKPWNISNICKLTYQDLARFCQIKKCRNYIFSDIS